MTLTSTIVVARAKADRRVGESGPRPIPEYDSVDELRSALTSNDNEERLTAIDNVLEAGLDRDDVVTGDASEDRLQAADLIPEPDPEPTVSDQQEQILEKLDEIASSLGDDTEGSR